MVQGDFWDQNRLMFQLAKKDTGVNNSSHIIRVNKKSILLPLSNDEQNCPLMILIWLREASM